MQIVQSIIVISAAMGVLIVCTRTQRTTPRFTICAMSIPIMAIVLADSELVTRSATVQLILLVLLLVVAATQVSRRLLSGGAKLKPSLAPLLIVLPGFVFFAANGLMNPEYSDSLVFGRFAAVVGLIALVFICGFAKTSVREWAPIGVSIVLIILALSAAGSANWRPCDVFKCGPFSAIFTGIFPSENALAMFCGVGILMAFMLRGILTKLAVLLPLLLALFASESRSSQIAVCISLVTWAAYLVVNMRQDANSTGRRARIRNSDAMMAIATAGFFSLGTFLVYNSSSETFSNRGGIWWRGVNALGTDWVSGVGMDRWVYLQSVGVLPLLFPHSQYLLLLFGGGVAGVLAVFILLNVAHARQIRSGESIGFAGAYVAFLSIIGLTEIYWNPGAIDGHLFIIMPLIFMLMSSTDNSKLKSAGSVPRKFEADLKRG